MRRMVSVILCLCLLAFPVQAAQSQRCVAIVFADAPGVTAKSLLEGLEKRGVQATFFISAARAALKPEEVALICQSGHELGLQIPTLSNGVPLSRRALAGEIVDTRALLSRDAKAKWLLPQDGCTDAARQVAKAKNLAILELNGSPDVILIDVFGADGALAMVDNLLAGGCRIVTLTELARLRGVGIQPGRIYGAFPPQRPASVGEIGISAHFY